LYGLNKYGKSVKELLLLPILSHTKRDAELSSRIELEMEKKGEDSFQNRRNDCNNNN